MQSPDPRVSCDTCGTYTGIDSHLCGRCATDWNDRDQAAGKRRINARRRVNGLQPLEETPPAVEMALGVLRMVDRDVTMGRWSNDA